jgi:uncharacterized membrane protein
VLAFSDGLFAIAMTLLVVAIGVPTLSDGDSVHELAEALNDLSPELISFFISFAVIGRYWAAHHLFFAQLARMDRGLIGLNLVYLAFVAFLPFPTALLGEYFDNPLSVVIYAVNVALVSGMEVVLFRHAHRAGLSRRSCRRRSTAGARRCRCRPSSSSCSLCRLRFSAPAGRSRSGCWRLRSASSPTVAGRRRAPTSC